MRVLVSVRATVTFDEDDKAYVDDVLIEDCELVNIDPPVFTDYELGNLSFDDMDYLNEIKKTLGECYSGFLRYIKEYELIYNFDLEDMVSMYVLNFVGIYKSSEEFYEILCKSSPISSSVKELRRHGEELFFTHDLKNGDVLILRQPFDTFARI